ncbi:MAG: hypothetical protein CM1200mP41_38900 [Gammaproteobacteria bacterium]|nr:MAG: hypothetical protein CM1200mP41_38900 [Gammaproteobacteria bacterium]
MAEAGNRIARAEQTSSEFVFGEIHRLGLENNVLELEEQGFTIVPDALPMGMVERMREVIIDQVGDKNGGSAPILRLGTRAIYRQVVTYYMRIQFSKSWS